MWVTQGGWRADVVVSHGPQIFLYSQFRISEYAPLNMMGVQRPPSPERQRESLVGHEGGSTGGDTGTQYPGRILLPGAVCGWVTLELPEDSWMGM